MDVETVWTAATGVRRARHETRLDQKENDLAGAGALLLLGSAGAGQAMAYFTTYVTAAGGHPVTLGYETQIEEEVENMTKHIVIANTGESDCYVRVKVFSGSQFPVSFSQEADGPWRTTATGTMMRSIQVGREDKRACWRP